MGRWIGTQANRRLFDLEQPRRKEAPIHPSHQPPGYSYLLHRRHAPGPERRTSASGVMTASEHSGTHIDALCHQAWDGRLHGGADAVAAQGSFGFSLLGAEAMAPILTRGWLIDLGLVAEPGWISLERVRRAASEQTVEPAPGDVVLIRTANGANWQEPQRYLRGPGMAPAVSSWLAELRPRAVGADNLAWDWLEPDPAYGTLPGHTILLVQHGIHILENLYLEELAAAGVRSFTFVCLPLKLVGATGSPVRPIALLES
ncbi:MAG: cyclase family protein [Candidatus Dormibacter sp.]|uniref:cyclase family protein n=1 Tax=Candidatus Dormibacter sp. TaxID=2973982 RepID=UPI0026904F5C